MTSSGLKAIYERPGGEYAELGLNLYAGCSHNCVYCYNKLVDRSQGRYDQPTKKASLQNIQSDLMILQVDHDKGPVHISFVGDRNLGKPAYSDNRTMILQGSHDRAL